MPVLVDSMKKTGSPSLMEYFAMLFHPAGCLMLTSYLDTYQPARYVPSWAMPQSGDGAVVLHQS
jgi:excinuclease UvrABC helicase subunit UvrB